MTDEIKIELIRLSKIPLIIITLFLLSWLTGIGDILKGLDNTLETMEKRNVKELSIANNLLAIKMDNIIKEVKDTNSSDQKLKDLILKEFNKIRNDLTKNEIQKSINEIKIPNQGMIQSDDLYMFRQCYSNNFTSYEIKDIFGQSIENLNLGYYTLKKSIKLIDTCKKPENICYVPNAEVYENTIVKISNIENVGSDFYHLSLMILPSEVKINYFTNEINQNLFK
jgi:hypothetical protein